MSRICRKCGTEFQPRKVVFGKGGYIMPTVCECQATQLAVRHQHTSFEEKTGGSREIPRKTARTR